MTFPLYGWATKWHQLLFPYIHPADRNHVPNLESPGKNTPSVASPECNEISAQFRRLHPHFLTWSNQGNTSIYRPGMGMAAAVEKLAYLEKAVQALYHWIHIPILNFILHKICCIILFIEKNNPPIFGDQFCKFSRKLFLTIFYLLGHAPPPKKKIGPIPKNHFWQFFSTPFWPRPKNVFVKFSESSPCVVLLCMLMLLCIWMGSGGCCSDLRAKPHLVASG